MTLPDHIKRRLALPLIAAPMFTVSGPDLVIAACRNGVIGGFPTANCRSIDELDIWLKRIRTEISSEDAPFCANLIMRREETEDEIELLLRHGVELVLTSVGSPRPAVERLHAAGALVFADVATLRHARRAIESGVDGLVLLSAGAGGQTGWINGMSFARAVRKMFDGIIILSGGISDGATLLAAQTIGCDLAMMGTPFIATDESLAPAGYREMVVASEIDDVILTSAITGLASNMLRPSLIGAGLDPNALSASIHDAMQAETGAAPAGVPKRWKDLWSAGHSVSGVDAIVPVAERIARIREEYRAAQQEMRALLE